jgi:signal transduction histidine kinase
MSGSVHVVEDITGLARFTRMTQEFVATVAHELRTPLTSIRGYLELVLEGDLGRVPPSQKEALSIVLDHATQLERLIAEYLDLSHIELGTVPLNREPFDLRPAVEEAARTLRPALDEREMSVHLDLPDMTIEVIADRGRIVQVLLNLMGNALKYTPNGGRLEVRVTAGTERVQVDVIDSGVGIPEDEQPYIFLQFFRSSSATQIKAQGAGLGLTIAKSIVELHGGEMWFSSRVGQGSTFSFWLPYAVVTESV